MDYSGMIEAYLLSRKDDFKDNQTFRRYQKQLTESIDFLEHSEYSNADDKFMEALSKYLQGKYELSTARKRMNLTRKFLLWCEKRKGEDKMMNEQQAGHEDTEELCDMAAAEKVSEANDTPSTASEQTALITEEHANDAGENEEKHEARKSGRPKLGSEARTERLTVYLTPTLYRQVKILANLDDVTIPNFIFGVLQKTVDANQEDITEQMQLQEKRKARQA